MSEQAENRIREILEPGEQIERELFEGEQLLWAGRPRQGAFLRISDAALIPMGLLWTAFAVFMATIVFTLGGWDAAAIAIIPGSFVLIGLYFLIGRFIVDAWVRSRIFYGLTTGGRAIVISGRLMRRVQSVDLPSLKNLKMTEYRNGRGTIIMGSGTWPWALYGHMGTTWPGVAYYAPPAFEHILDARKVYQMICDLQRSIRPPADENLNNSRPSVR